MTTEPFDHIGILIADLDEAARRFSAALGLTFTDPIHGRAENFVEEAAASSRWT